MLEKLLKTELMSFGHRNFEGSKKKSPNLRSCDNLEILQTLIVYVFPVASSASLHSSSAFLS